MLKKVSVLIVALLALMEVNAQVWDKKDTKYKGASEDGSDRSEYFFKIEKLDYPVDGVCEGEPVMLSLTVENVFAYTYQWKKIAGGTTVAVGAGKTNLEILRSALSDRGKYFCEVSDVKTGKTLYSDTVELKIRKMPVVRITNFTYPKTICYGDTVKIDASATESDKESLDTYTYFWAGAAIIGATNQIRIEASPEQNTIYGLTVDNGGCISTGTVEVRVNKAEVDLPDFIYKTQGERLQLDVDAPETTTLSWIAGGVSYGNINPFVISAVTENLDIKVTMQNGECSAADSSRLLVRRNTGFLGGVGDGFERADHQVRILNVAEPGLLCEGTEEARMEVTYDGTLAYNFEWKKVGSDGVLSDSTVLVFRDVALTDRGQYFCRLIDMKSGAVTYSDTVEFKIKKRPNVIIGSPELPKLLCYGDNVVLNASATEADKEQGDTYSYLWQGEGIIGTNNTSVVKVGPKVNTVYRLTVRNGECFNVLEAQVNIYRPIVDLPDYVYISEGNTLELPVDVPEGARLIWTADGSTFEGMNPFLYPDITKSLEVKVKMINDGCSAEDNCMVYVKRGRGYKGGIQDGFDMTCVPPSVIGQPVSVTCGSEVAELEVIAEGTELSYFWQRYDAGKDTFVTYVPPMISNALGLGSHRLLFNPIVPEDNGLYRCMVVNECGEVSTDTVLLSVGGSPVLKRGLQKEWAQCAGASDSVYLEVEAIDPMGKAWKPEPLEGLHYTWYRNGRKLTGAAYDRQNFLKWEHTEEAEYLVNIQNECGNTRDSVKIPVLSGAQIVEPIGDVLACMGGNAEFVVTVNGGGTVNATLLRGPKTAPQMIAKTTLGRYTMTNVQPADEGEYFWAVDNGCGVDTSAMFYLAVNNKIEFTARTKDTLLCANENLDLTVEVNDHISALTYNWYRNGRPTGISSKIFSIRNANASDAGSYTCKVSNGCPAQQSDPITVTIKEQPRITTQPYLKSSYCEGDTVTIGVTVANPGTLDSVRWYYENRPLADITGKIAGAATMSLKLRQLKPADAGAYHVQLFSSCGGIRSNVVTLKVDLAPVFDTGLSGYRLDLCDGDNATLTVQASGAAPITYTWTHNDKTIKTGYEPSVTLRNIDLDSAGRYCVKIENRCGNRISCTEIKVSRPDTFHFELNSITDHVCQGDRIGLTAVLKGSDTTTLYSLYKTPDEFVRSIHGKNVVPRQGYIEFKELMGGNYYVVGEGPTGCKYRMPGEVKITESPQPLVFNTFVEKHICQDLQQAVVVLDSSERNTAIEYTLMVAGGSSWTPYLDKQKGTGDTLRWKNVPEGTYKIVAKNTMTGCGVDMAGEVEIAVHDLPLAFNLIAKNGDSTYCSGARSDVVLMLAGSETNVTYTLREEKGVVAAGVTIPSWSAVEAGIYHVTAENRWGCKNTMGHQVVKALAPPAMSSIRGGKVYCKDEKGSGEITVAATEEGTLYRMYRENPASLFLDTMGIGGVLVIKVPLENKSYYVVAEDTTSEHCRTRLTGTAIFKESVLKVVCNPDEYTISSGSSQQLNAGVSGEVGTPVITWKPEEQLDLLTLAANPKAPVTLPLDRRVDYTVRVTDETSCSDSAVVSVLVTSAEHFRAEIRATDKITPIGDTLRACKGAEINLYAWVDGGSGIYDYRWRDESGNKGTDSYLSGYTRPAEGFLWLEVDSDSRTAKDSVWVKLYDTPKAQTLLTDGVICAQNGVPVQMKLNGSQKNIRYILCYSSDNTRYNEIDTIAGTGAGIQFSVANAYTREGFYKVKAENTFNGANCQTWMNGMAEIKKGARKFTLSGNKTYCEGINDIDTIRMQSSQSGITYTLYRKPSERKALQSGKDNTPLEFTGRFGTGEYFVLGTNGVCTDTMSGTVTVQRNLLPVDLGLSEKGGYCGDCPEQITVAPAADGIDYMLYRKNAGLADVMLETVQGTGTLKFARQCGHGEYYVIARNTETQCERIFADRVKIGVMPADVPVQGEGKYCDSQTAYTAGFHISNPQDGVDYRLFTVLDSVYVGAFDSVALSGLYYTKPLQSGTYQVIASIGTTDACTYKLSQNLTVIKYALPDNNALLEPYTVCQGEGQLRIGVTTTDGFTYDLYYNNGRDIVHRGTVPGSGGEAYFGSFGDLGSYHVMAKNNAYACEWRVPGEYRVDKPLEVFHITGDDRYCLADGGVVIGIDSTERDVKYVLQKWDTLNYAYKDVDELTGKGRPVVFKGYFGDGKYKVKAVRGCERDMNGILEVRSKAMPSAATRVELLGNGCQDSTIVIGLRHTEADVIYSLYFNGNPAGGDIISNGTDTAWHIARAGLGTYRVTADKENCLVTMPYTIEIGRCPFVNELQGDTLLCANLTGTLYMEAGRWDKGAVYVLYTTAGDSVTTGTERNGDGKLYFGNVPPGSFYAVAMRGNCIIQGDRIHTIRAASVPVLPENFWTVTNCVLSGEGKIRVTGMSPGVRYIMNNSAGAELFNYKGAVADTAFNNLDFERYCIYGLNEDSDCKSDILCEEIREGVGEDVITGDFYYCGDENGARLHLSGTGRNMRYMMKTKTGELIEQLVAGSTAFIKEYKEGKYVFRKERTGFMGGCYAEDTIVIVRYENPLLSVKLEAGTSGGSLCANGDYNVRLKQTELNIQYILIKDAGSATEVYADTLVGNGTDLQFRKRVNDVGTYKVYAQPLSGLCGNFIDTSFRLNPLPRPVTLQACDYCIPVGGKDSCAVGLSGMQAGIAYYLPKENASPLTSDTLYGPGAKVFRPRVAGKYILLATDTLTGCRDTLGNTQIREWLKPKQYTVDQVCDTVGEIRTFDGSDGDTVSYYLFRDTVQLAGPVKGNGGNISFGTWHVPGIYKIKAVSNHGCEIWMNDSATIYGKPNSYILSQKGNYCTEGTAGVTIHYSGSDPGWNYFLKKVMWYTDTVAGNGEALEWNTIAGNGILSQGTYELYRVNACARALVTSLTVNANPLPKQFNLTGSDGALCAGGNGLEISLAGSELGVTYKLALVKEGVENELKQVTGTGFGIDFEKFSEAGQYIVYGVVDTSGCRLKMGERMFWPGALPDKLGITGNDICLGDGVQATTTVCLDGTMQDGVNYYLQIKKDGIVPPLDTLSAGEGTCFKEQTETACYYVTAQNISSGCEATMDGLLCIGLPPVKHNLVKAQDTVNLCRGEQHCIQIDGSNVGNKYILLKDGVETGTPVAGDGYNIQVGCVAESGVYRVKALAGIGCDPVTFDDSIVVRVHELPVVNLIRERAFCARTEGVSITVGTPTDPLCKYELFSPLGVRLDSLGGNSGELRFKDLYAEPGTYRIRVTNPSLCILNDSVVLTRNLLPQEAVLSGSNGTRICVGGSAAMTVDISELGVEYLLYRYAEGGVEKLMGRKYGTAGQLTIASVREPGTYFVEAVNIATGCKVRMEVEKELTMAPALDTFRLEGIRAGYCYTDTRKGSVALAGSRNGIFYQLQRDSVPYGALKEGAGNRLLWDGLEGKTASVQAGVPDNGYLYQVTALDTATGCVAWMSGRIGIIEEADVRLISYSPSKDTTVCEGERMSFTVAALGGNLNYRWKLGKNIVKDTAENFLTLPGVKTTDFGSYVCEVSNTCGSQPTQPVRLKVKGALKYLKRMENVAVCAGSDVTLTGYIQNGTENEWFRAGSEDDLLSVDSWYTLSAVTVADAGTYIYRSKNDCGVLSDTVVLRVDTEMADNNITFRIDTLCAGSSYSLQLTSGDSIKWYLGNNFTGITGNDFILDAVVPANEGLYVAHIFNACGEKSAEVARLNVDDTIRVIAVHPDEAVCAGSMVDLYVRTNPDKRISYTWVYNDDTIPGANKSTLKVGPVTADRSEQVYEVIYSNKCGEGRDTTILTVSDRIEYEDPIAQILMCNAPGMPEDTLIYVKHKSPVDATYQWYWRETAGGDPLKLDGEVSDTLHLAVNTDTRGYYFCEIGKVCNPAITENSWVRIDTVPVLKNNLLKHDTVCEKTPFRLQLAATGGDLNYEWGCRLSNGSLETHLYDTVAMASSSTFDFGNIGLEYDSCKIWCRVYNGCHEVTTDTLLLRVNALPKIQLSPKDTTICEFGAAQAVIHQLAGTRPWSYTYALDDKEPQSRTCRTSRDTLWLGEAGTWRLSALTDGLCSVAGVVDSVKVQVTKVPKITLSNISAQDTVCLGGLVEYRLSVEDGTGPFEITLVDSTGQPAEELELEWPYRLTGNTAVLTFRAVSDATYRFGTVKDQSAAVGACPVHTAGELRVVIDQPVPVSFKALADNHLGACHTVDLDTFLAPQPAGGVYIVNGVMNGNLYRRQPGCDTVRYVVNSSVGCASERTVWLYTDSLPAARISLPENVCQGTNARLQIAFNGAGYSFDLTRSRLKRSGSGEASEQHKLRLTAAGKDYSESLTFLSADSCLAYRLASVTDRFGCVSDMVSDDTVNLRLYPELKLYTRYPDLEGQRWETAVSGFTIVQGDSVGVRAVLNRGVMPWNLYIAKKDGNRDAGSFEYTGLTSAEKTFRIGDNKTHYFTVEDSYCQNPDAAWRNVNYADTGYIRIAALLEGPYDQSLNAMTVGRKYKVPLLPGMSGFPNVGKATIIDWVEVSLRKASTVEKAVENPGTQVYAVNCLLLSDGSIVDAKGNNNLVIPYIVESPVASYYVLLRHRNHLAVMSASSYTLGKTKATAPLVDFRYGNIYTGDGVVKNHMSQVASGSWALSAGEFDRNALTSMFDVNGIAFNRTGDVSYSIYDINFDGKVDWDGTRGSTRIDWSVVWKNKDKHSEIKWK